MPGLFHKALGWSRDFAVTARETLALTLDPEQAETYRKNPNIAADFRAAKTCLSLYGASFATATLRHIAEETRERRKRVALADWHIQRIANPGLQPVSRRTSIDIGNQLIIDHPHLATPERIDKMWQALGTAAHNEALLPAIQETPSTTLFMARHGTAIRKPRASQASRTHLHLVS